MHLKALCVQPAVQANWVQSEVMSNLTLITMTQKKNLIGLFKKNIYIRPKSYFLHPHKVINVKQQLIAVCGVNAVLAIFLSVPTAMIHSPTPFSCSII